MSTYLPVPLCLAAGAITLVPAGSFAYADVPDDEHALNVWAELAGQSTARDVLRNFPWLQLRDVRFDDLLAGLREEPRDASYQEDLLHSAELLYQYTKQRDKMQGTHRLAAASEHKVQRATSVVCYYIGTQGARYLKGLPLVTAGAAQMPHFRRGFEEAMQGKLHPVFTGTATDPRAAEAKSCLQHLQQLSARRMMNLAARQEQQGSAYLRQHAMQPGVVTTPSGLQYRELQAGSGETYSAQQYPKGAIFHISVHGRLLDGTVFENAQEPLAVTTDVLVAGMKEALHKMPIGAEWELSVPPALAYGDRYLPPIPPRAVLIFKLKLHNIEPVREAPTYGDPSNLPPEVVEKLRQQGITLDDQDESPQS